MIPISDLQLFQGEIESCVIHLLTDLIVIHFMYKNYEFYSFYFIVFLSRSLTPHKIIILVFFLNQSEIVLPQIFVHLHLLEL